MIYITGDTHGDYDIEKIDKIKTRLTSADYLIICGDFGVYWQERNEALVKYYSELPCTILWVDGNHEGFEIIDDLPLVNFYGGIAQKCWKNCYRLLRGEIYIIDGISFFTFGGAESIDKYTRVPFVSWWEREMPSEAEMRHGLERLDSFGGKVDIILSHDAPAWWNEEYYSNPIVNNLNKYFDYIYQTYEWGWWFFGHHHIDECFSDNLLCCLYNKFVTVKNVNGHITFDFTSL